MADPAPAFIEHMIQWIFEAATTLNIMDHRQFAIFQVTNGKPSAAPSTVVVLPRGIGAASPSPDGKRFAIGADPRPPDPLIRGGQ